ncbi:MAG: DUF11 domain-containing protein [bacterium]|nr:DUF11 domain-containing protein [bacterium]
MKNAPTSSFRRVFSTLLLAAFALASAANAQTATPTFAKSFDPDTIGPGSVSTLQFDITNGSSSPVRNLAFTDDLPAGMTIASPANASSTCLGTLSAPDGGSAITLAGGGVGAVSSCTITVDVTSSTVGTHQNVSGDLTSDAGNSGGAEADLTVAADRPGFTKSFSPSSVFFGARSTLTLTIDNTANAQAARQFIFTDNLPFGMEVADPANAATDCPASILNAAPGASVIAMSPNYSSFDSLDAGASCSVSVDVIGGAVGVLGNTTGNLSSWSAGVTRVSGKASATLAVTVETISLTKTFTDDPTAPGATTNLEFTVRNLDRRSSATSIAFTDDLDAALSGLVATGLPLSNPCGPGSSLDGTSLLTLTGGNLGPEGTCTFSVTLQVPAAAVAGAYTNTTSSITAEIDGTPVVGDPATDLLFVEPVPVLTKTFIGDPVGAGDSIDLEFTITNTSTTASATEITFEDVFVSELPTASAIPEDDFCGVGSTATYTPLINPAGSDAILAKLVVAGASLAPGASCTFSLTLDVAVGAATNTYSNTTSEITATIDGETITGNPASDSFDVVAAPALVKEFTDDPVQPGGTVTLEFTLTHDENAPGDATDVTFTDDLDAALMGLVATGLPASDVCGIGSEIDGTTTLTFSGGTLAPGESCTFSVTLQVPTWAAAGDHTNTTSGVVASVLGVTAMENAAADDLKIAGLTLTKEFIDDPALPGGTVTLEFTIENISPVATPTGILFQDHLDGVLNNLAATGLPLNDVCGTGSKLEGLSGGQFLLFTGGTLAPGESCTFAVTLQVPAAAAADTYVNSTSVFAATIDGATVIFDNASDELTIATDFLTLTKEFIDDPVGPGDNVNLQFFLINLDTSQAASNLAFTDDLDAALEGLVATGLPIAACGGTVAGTDTISFTGGSLAAAASCSFDVSLSVPSSVPLGTIATNTTSQVTGTIGGLGVTGDPASDDLRIDFLEFSKAFGGDAVAGGTVTLTFTLQNLNTSDIALDLNFTDDLNAVIPGLEAIGLPVSDVCGEGSEVSGTSLLLLRDAVLLPGGSCTFSVDLQVPASATPGSYVNVTGDLLQGGTPVAAPATDALDVTAAPVDDDGDGVLNGDDVCDDTVIPESVPTVRLGRNRYALVDGDGIFDTNPPPGGGPGDVFTIFDTAGCSCEQIIVAQGLGKGHVKFGCSVGAMNDWVELVNP